uniref:BPTI/Kunitz inhibitor domain-containing protein n=1 Tax=Panagrolaimus superbus TaxID=310955 RepID=A0A914XTC4_9BILA
MIEPQPATVFTPRPIFRANPTTVSPPVEHVTIFGPPQKPDFDVDACVMPPDSGKCRNFVTRWFYNAEKGSCREFTYGSCGGNANNFADKAICEARCVPSINAILPQRCNYPKDEGFGIEYHPKWYFNGRNLRCEQMVFRGSGGNDNQFSSQRDCDLSCKPVQGHFVPQVPQPPPRKNHKDTDKKPLPINSAHGTLTAQEGGYDGAGVPSPVHTLPDNAPAPVPNAPTANAPAEKQPTAPAPGPAPATAPHAPSVDVNQYVPATPPLREEYNSVEEAAAPAPVAPAAPAHAPTPSVSNAQTPAASSSNSNVEGGDQNEGYNNNQGHGSAAAPSAPAQPSAPTAPLSPPTHTAPEQQPSSNQGSEASLNHAAGIPVGRGKYEEPNAEQGINHSAAIGSREKVENAGESNTIDMESVDGSVSNGNEGMNVQGTSSSSNNVQTSHGSASSSSSSASAAATETHGNNGAKYETTDETVEGGSEASETEVPAAPESHGSANNNNNNYNAIPAEVGMVPTADSHLPMLGPSPKMTIDYSKGIRVDNNNNAKAEGIRTANSGDFISEHLTDKDLDSVKTFNGGVEDEEEVEEAPEESPRIPVCPNGLQAKLYDNGRPVMCLPGKDQCPENSVCYFNGMDYFCCPNTDDPYDQHIFGGYDGEEVKHGYKSVPTSLNIRAIRRKRQTSAGGIPPSSFSIDHITKPLRFDDKPVKQISRAGSVDALARLRVNPCTQEVEEGDCNDAHLRYFYDIKTDTCRLFYYSGCNGNANNFITQNECNQRCKLGIIITTTEAPVPPGRCPGGKLPLGDNAPVLCGNQTDSIGCPRGYYCRNGPPDKSVEDLL